MSSLITCPACRRKHPLPLAELKCSRCGLDLGDLERILRAARDQCQAALDALGQGDYETALARASESWNLKHDPSSARVAFIAGAAQGDLDTAGSWRSVLLTPSL